VKGRVIEMRYEALEKGVEIRVSDVVLEGDLFIPGDAKGIVLFAHGSGSSRHSPRNRYVAGVLQKEGMATLLIDLLTKKEDSVYETRFNIDLLVTRLLEITEWLKGQEETKSLSVGYFGASTGAAAALKAAARSTLEISAVVSRGGRPDLAESALEKVGAPTLLIVGGDDSVVIELNQVAYRKLNSPKELVIVPGATHLFEEPGTLEEVARLATRWFQKYLI
jgi:dienelactone hydrolase